MVEGRYGVVATHADRAAPDIDPAVALDGLGTRWLQLEASYKLYPCAHAIHAFIEAAGQLRAQHGLTPEMIARVTAIVPEHFAGQIAEPRAEKLQPRTPTHARASLPYAVAHMLRARCAGRLCGRSDAAVGVLGAAGDRDHGGCPVRLRDRRCARQPGAAAR